MKKLLLASLIFATAPAIADQYQVLSGLYANAHLCGIALAPDAEQKLGELIYNEVAITALAKPNSQRAEFLALPRDIVTISLKRKVISEQRKKFGGTPPTDICDMTRQILLE